MLSVRDLSRPPAVNDVSFEMRAGEIVGLAGLIGSGRSEVARAIFGADRRDGAAEVEVARSGFAPLAARGDRHGVVMLPEDRKAQGLLMLRSLADNVTLPHLADASRRPGCSIRRRSAAAPRDAHRARRRARELAARSRNTLSGGNQQKVLFAKWLFRRPHVFIADEPTRGVDVGAKRAIYELIHSLAAEGSACC